MTHSIKNVSKMFLCGVAVWSTSSLRARPVVRPQHEHCLATARRPRSQGAMIRPRRKQQRPPWQRCTLSKASLLVPSCKHQIGQQQGRVSTKSQKGRLSTFVNNSKLPYEALHKSTAPWRPFQLSNAGSLRWIELHHMTRQVDHHCTGESGDSCLTDVLKVMSYEVKTFQMRLLFVLILVRSY